MFLFPYESKVAGASHIPTHATVPSRRRLGANGVVGANSFRRGVSVPFTRVESSPNALYLENSNSGSTHLGDWVGRDRRYAHRVRDGRILA